MGISGSEFVKQHEELCDKTNNSFKDKQKKEVLWEPLAASRYRDTESEMEISMTSDVTHQPSSTSPKRRQPPVATATTSADPVLDQFQQMRSMISTFLGARQNPTPSPRQSFCNYLHSEIENLEERDFLTFRNDTVKLLSEYSTRPKNARDRSPQVKRSPHIKFQKHHSPQQDGNTY